MNAIDIFPWDDHYNTGIALIDAQHKTLVQRLNKLASHIAFGADITELGVIFDELADYAVQHFQAEQAIWHAFLADDALTAGHQESQLQFLQQLEPLRSAVGAGDETVTGVLAFLVNWLSRHILETDRFCAALVKGTQSGLSLEQARQQAKQQMSGDNRVLIDSLLAKCESLSSNMLRLLRELTLRRRDEKSLSQLSLAVQQSPNPILITDLEGRIEFVNQAFIQCTGYQRSEVLGQNPRFLKSAKTSPHLFGELWDTLKSGGVWKGEFINRRKDGSEFIESALISPVHQANGKISHYLAIKEDITDRKRTEQALQDAQELAEQYNIAKSEFLANMSHEIRTPMNTIIGLTHLAMATPLNHQQRDYLEKIQEASEYLLGTLNEILDFSKIESQRLVMVTADFDLIELLNYLDDHFARRAREKSLNFSMRVDGDVPRHLHGDAPHLQQVLSNLLGNSIKFTEQGFVRLSVMRGIAENGRVQIQFSVEDSGIGISEAQQNRLFQPFVQADTSTTRQYGGAGLGLAISRKIIQMMGGDIQFKSEAGVGAIFWFELFFTLAESSANPVRSTLRQHTERLTLLHDDISLHNVRVLVAEDDELNRLVAKEILQNAGLQVVTANNGREVLDVLMEQDFDIVLMDIQMPVMDGLQAIQRIRDIPRLAGLPIIVVSVGTSWTEQAECRQVGMTDFIAKPFDAALMLEKIKQVLVETASKKPPVSLAAGEFNWPGFDQQRLRDLATMLGSNEAVRRGILQLIDDFADIEQLLADQLARDDKDSACEVLHKLKAAAATQGAMPLVRIVDNIEHSLRQGLDAHVYWPAFCQAWRTVVRTADALRIERPNDACAENPASFEDDVAQLRALIMSNKLVPLALLSRVTSVIQLQRPDAANRLHHAIRSFNYDDALSILEQQP